MVDNNIHIDCGTWVTSDIQTNRNINSSNALRRSALCISLLTVIGFARSRGVKRATVDIHFNVTLIQV